MCWLDRGGGGSMDDQADDGGRSIGEGIGALLGRTFDSGTVNAAGADVGADIGSVEGEGDLAGVSGVAEPPLVHGLDDADACRFDLGVVISGDGDCVADVLEDGVSEGIECFLHGLGAHHPEEAGEGIGDGRRGWLGRGERLGCFRGHAGS